jgi:hypothetical protein
MTMTLAQAHAYLSAAERIERRRRLALAVTVRGAQADQEGWESLLEWLGA